MDRKYRKFEISGDSLKGCSFFDGQDEMSRTQIARLCEGRIYARGAEVIRHLANDEEVFFIQSGKVEATMLTMNGKLVNFQELHTGEMFGEVSALDGLPRTTSVITCQESALIRMSGSNFRKLVLGSPKLAERTMCRLCGLTRHLIEKAYEPRAYSVPDQIRLEIYREFRRVTNHRVGEHASATIHPAPTHKDVAERVGTTREQVTRVLRELAERGLMRQDKRSWIADDTAALSSHLENRLHPIDC